MKTTKISYKYGAMNSGKSLELMKVAFNYRENNIIPLILKPKTDTRFHGKVSSRTGITQDAIEIDANEIDELKNHINKETKIILIDESQFLSKVVIDEIVKLSYENEVEALMFFGLKSDFRGELFEGSKRIIELSDKIEETTSICWCGKKARQNVRLINGEITKNGPTILVDDKNTEVKYTTLCNYHYFFEQLGENHDK